MRKLIFSTLLIIPLLYGKVLLPQENLIAESLVVKGKFREYYRLDNNSYLVSGPSVVTVYARLAVPKNDKGVHSFSIKSFLSDSPESTHQFHKKVDASVSSLLHPMHRYTKSAKVEIEIPMGEFMISIENASNIGNPILTRVIQKKRKR